MTDLTIFKQAFDALPSPSPDRATAFETFHELGLPTRRLEEWKYTDLGGLDRADLADQIAAPDFDPWTKGKKIDLVNGHLAACDLTTQEAGALDIKGNALAALNAAFAPAPVEATLTGEQVVEVRHLVGDAEARAAHGRLALTVAPMADLTLIERFEGDASAYWQNVVLDLTLGLGARVRHVRYLGDGSRAVHTSLVRVWLRETAQYDLTQLSQGGEQVRSDVQVTSCGEGTRSSLAAVQLARPGQSLDLRSFFDHRVPNTLSDQRVRNVLARQGKTAFQGKVRVARHAQKTDAQQSAKSLLLDRTAEANTKPELEIYADDVVCAHGATVGELDARQLFYLMSRGLSEAEAKSLLIEAFVAELFDGIEIEPVRDRLATSTRYWLQG